jgi:hypothetical protein
VTEIFLGALAKEWQLKCKTFFYQRTKKDLLAIENVIDILFNAIVLGENSC